MPIRGLLDALGRDTEGGRHGPHLVESQRGVERLAEHLLLMGVGVAGIQLDETTELRHAFRTEQVAHKQQAAGRHDADHFRQALFRSRNVVDDAVGHHHVELAVLEREPLGVEMCERDPFAEAGGRDVLGGDVEHRLSQIGRRNVPVARAPAQLDGN